MYEVTILPHANEFLTKIDKSISQRIVNKITWLSENIDNIIPLPLKSNLSGFYKLRIGDWRVIYDFNPDEKNIFIHNIGHRKDIYE